MHGGAVLVLRVDAITSLTTSNWRTFAREFDTELSTIAVVTCGLMICDAINSGAETNCGAFPNSCGLPLQPHNCAIAYEKK